MLHSFICHHLIYVVVLSTWHSVVVASICHHNLANVIIQLVNQPLSHYVYVRITPTRKGPIPPNNPPCSQAYPDLIPHTWSFEFLGKPIGIEWSRFLNTKTSSIQANEATLSCDTPLKPVLPFSLKNDLSEQCNNQTNKQHSHLTHVNE